MSICGLIGLFHGIIPYYICVVTLCMFCVISLNMYFVGAYHIGTKNTVTSLGSILRLEGQISN